MLSKDAFGTIYELAPCDGGGGNREVVKIIDKTRVQEIQELKRLDRQVDVMRIVGSDDFRHPNVVQLYEVYRFWTHLFFRIEFGGNEDLYRRLLDREKEGPGCRPLSAMAARPLAQQVVAPTKH